MSKNNDWDIRFIDADEWEDAMAMVYRIFLEYDAKDFSEEGIEHFRAFIADNNLKQLFYAGGFQVIGAYYKQKMVGLAALREQSHISLLFVEGEYQHIGVGTELINVLAEYAHNKLHVDVLTVNASFFATEFYHKLGFTDTSSLKMQDGVIFTPMQYLIKEN